MDAILLRKMIRDAARTAFTTIQQENPGERFYAYALQSLDDATGVYAAANTETWLKLTVDRYRYRNKKDHPEPRYFEWYWGEWAFRNIQDSLFNGIYEYIERYTEENCDNVTQDMYDTRRAVTFAAMTASLADLDSEGLFGKGADREAITLFCTVNNSLCNACVEEESVARLNGSQVNPSYLPIVLEDYAQPQAQPFHHLFVEHLEQLGLKRPNPSHGRRVK